jgi:hypothetical protein
LGQFFDTFPFFLFSALSPDKIYVVPSLIFVAFAAPSTNRVFHGIALLRWGRGLASG